MGEYSRDKNTFYRALRILCGCLSFVRSSDWVYYSEGLTRKAFRRPLEALPTGIDRYVYIRPHEHEDGNLISLRNFRHSRTFMGHLSSSNRSSFGLWVALGCVDEYDYYRFGLPFPLLTLLLLLVLLSA